MSARSPATPMGSLAFCAFDERRGNEEGTEEDKLLYFYPTHVEMDEKCNLVGLLQGLIQFSRQCCANNSIDIVETNLGAWIVSYPEEHIVFAILAAKKAFPSLCKASFKAYMCELYQMVRLLNGSIETMLVLDPSGNTTRATLAPLLNDLLARTHPAHPHHSTTKLSNPLARITGSGQAMSNFRVSYAFQAACEAVHASCVELGGLSPSRYADVSSMVVYRRQVCHSNLHPGDTEALYIFCRVAWPDYFRGVGEVGSGGDIGGRAEVPVLYPKTWQRGVDGLLHVVGAAGYSGLGYMMCLGHINLPVLNINSSPCVLFPYFVHGYLLLLLLPRQCYAPITQKLRHLGIRIADVFSQIPSSAQTVLDNQTREHIQGQRFMRVDTLIGRSQCTPGGKLSTMTSAQVQAAALARDALATMQPGVESRHRMRSDWGTSTAPSGTKQVSNGRGGPSSDQRQDKTPDQAAEQENGKSAGAQLGNEVGESTSTGGEGGGQKEEGQRYQQAGEDRDQEGDAKGPAGVWQMLKNSSERVIGRLSTSRSGLGNAGSSLENFQDRKLAAQQHVFDLLSSQYRVSHSKEVPLSLQPKVLSLAGLLTDQYEDRLKQGERMSMVMIKGGWARQGEFWRELEGVQGSEELQEKLAELVTLLQIQMSDEGDQFGLKGTVVGGGGGGGGGPSYLCWEGMDGQMSKVERAMRVSLLLFFQISKDHWLLAYRQGQTEVVQVIHANEKHIDLFNESKRFQRLYIRK